MATSRFSSGPSMWPASVIDFIATAPFEISALVFAHLDNCHLKGLRLTCKKLANLVSPHLRFKRIFISASPLNVQVFRAIAEHETFRRDVREIVWDDARYEKPPPDFVRFEGKYDDECVYLDEYPGNSDDDDDYGPQKIPRENIDYPEERRGNDVKTLPQRVETFQQLDAQLPLDIACVYYQGLLEQQEQVLSTSADVAAFEWALEKGRFPNLKRITLTPAAHGILFKPLYPTPAIRALPLNLMVCGVDGNNYLAFRNGRLKQMLEADLRHFTLETDEDGSLEREPHPLNLTRDHFIPLRSIFPVDAWKHLAHFGLSRFLINQQGLLDFLTVLPQTLTR
ncbi:hypothetical protein ColTof3_03362 [Colletotrichum tofieldiae]|nr:hypothetical protein ColTof3_03362 [Colletotrichum tofieldiae]